MIDRCRDDPNYAGISVCDRWRVGSDGMTGLQCFVADMGPRPDGYSVDRIDKAGDYTPENCHWADRKTCARNKRSVKLTADDVAEIKARLLRGEVGKAIGLEFGISKQQVCNIKTGLRWADIEPKGMAS